MVNTLKVQKPDPSDVIMSLEKLALIAICVVGFIAFVGYGALIVIGMIETFPYGIPFLALIAVFVFIFISVIVQRIKNQEDDHYEKNIRQ